MSEVRMKLASLLAERCHATWLLRLLRTFLDFLTFLMIFFLLGWEEEMADGAVYYDDYVAELKAASAKNEGNEADINSEPEKLQNNLHKPENRK